MAPQTYLEQLDGQQYAGFNLIVGDLTTPDFWYTTNRGAHTTPRRLQPGVYGMSNGSLDDRWPKVGPCFLSNGTTTTGGLPSNSYPPPIKNARQMLYGERLATEMLRQGLFEQPAGFPWDALFELLSRKEALEGTGTLPDRGRGAAFEQAANCIFMKPFPVQNGLFFGTRSQIVLSAFASSGVDGPWAVELRERYLQGDNQWAHVASTLTVPATTCRS